MNDLKKPIPTSDSILHELLGELPEENNKTLKEIYWTICDQQDLKNDKNIIFVIDFLHVYEYAYPPIEQILKGEIDRIVLNRAALHFLFTQCNCGAPILLPHHIEELKEHIKNIYAKSISTFNVVDEIKQKTFLFSANEVKLIEKAYQSYEKDNCLSEDIRKEFVSLIISNNLSGVLSLLSGMTRDGLETIVNLIKNKNVIVDSELYNEYKETIEATFNPNEDEKNIFLVLNKIRPKSYRQNSQDAAVIYMVLSLNNELIKNPENNRVIYFISDAKGITRLFHSDWFKYDNNNYNDRDKKKHIDNIQKVLHIQKVDNIFGPADSIHRTTNIFLEYMTNTSKLVNRDHEDYKKIKEKTIDKLKENQKKFEELKKSDDIKIFFEEPFSQLIEGCSNNCDKCNKELSEKCENIKRAISEWRKNLKERYSLSVLKHVCGENHENFITQVKDSYEKAIKILTYFLQEKDDDLLKNEYTKRWDNLTDTYFKSIEQLSESLIGFKSEIFEEIIQKIEPTRRIPFNINFKNKVINEVLNEIRIEKTAKERNLSQIKNITDKLFHIVSSQDRDIEKCIFSAIIYYNFGKHEVVDNILKIHISDKNATLNREDYRTCLLIYLLSQHQLAINNNDIQIYKETFEHCQKAIKENLDDDRFQYMEGLIIRRGIEVGFEEDKEKQLNVVLEIFEKLSDINNILPRDKYDKLYLASILNSYAYTICYSEYKKETVNEKLIEKASEKFDLIKDHVIVKDWEANFFTTEGILEFLKAKIANDKGLYDETKIKLTNAKEKLEDAKTCAEKAKYFKYEINKIKTFINDVTNYEASIDLKNVF